jgi:hypothetical protein
MFQLNPINSDIRKELHFREASIAKTVLQSAKDPQTGKSNELTATFYPLGTIWIKMTSVVETPKSLGGVVMLGGEMLDPDGDGSFSKMRHGFDEMYTQPITDGEGEIQPSYFRPLAGVKGLSSTYDGGMKAIRNATVTWSCFSLKELNRLTPYFLSHGTSVLLEWGWTSNLVGQTFTFEEIKEGQCYTNIQDKIFKNGGNYDAMCGIIKNFSWSLREDGGFDCTTDVTSMGVSMIDSKVKQAVDLDYVIQERVEEDGSKVSYKMIPKVTMPKYIKDLSSQLKEFAEKPGAGVLFMEKEGGWMHFDVDIGPYVTWGWMEDNIISKFLSKVNTRTNLIISDMRSIIKGKSTIIMNHEKLLTTDRKSFIVPGQWPAESIRDSHLGDVLDNVQEDVKEKIAERKKEEEPDASTGWRSWGVVQFLGIDSAVDAIQSAGDFIVDAAAVGWEAIKAVVESLGDDFQEEVTREVAKRVNDEFDKFAVSDNLEDGGYLRNLLIHWKTIERAFGEVATVEAGFKNLFEELNKDFGLWDFSITSDQNNTGRMMVIDINYVNNSIESLLDDESRFEDGEVKGRLFKFKTWREESIVKAQGMEAKLPTSMATAAMLGRNTKSETVGEEDPQGEGAGAMNKDKPDPILGPMLQGWKFPSFGLMDPNPDEGAIPPLTIEAGPTLGELTPDDEDEVIIGTEGASGAQKGGGGSEDDSKIDTTDFQKVVSNIKALSEGDTLPVISHIYNQYGGMKPKYIKQMKALILAAPGGANKATADILVPIDLSLTIDGIGGIYPGNVFTSDYLPDDYKRTCVFQVKSISHEVGDTGWDCVLEGQIRISMSRIANKVKIANAGQ